MKIYFYFLIMHCYRIVLSNKWISRQRADFIIDVLSLSSSAGRKMEQCRLTSYFLKKIWNWNKSQWLLHIQNLLSFLYLLLRGTAFHSLISYYSVPKRLTCRYSGKLSFRCSASKKWGSGYPLHKSVTQISLRPGFHWVATGLWNCATQAGSGVL